MQRGATVVQGNLKSLLGSASTEEADPEAGPVATGQSGVLRNPLIILESGMQTMVLVAELKLDSAQGIESLPFASSSAEEGILLEEVRVKTLPAIGVRHVGVVIRVEHGHIVLCSLAVHAIVIMVVVESQLLVGAGKLNQILVPSQNGANEQVLVISLLVIGEQTLGK